MQSSTLPVMAVLVGYFGAAVTITLLTRSLVAVRRQADHDELTGLMRRGGVSRYVSERRRGGRSTTVVMLDLDHFKTVNDTYGHRAGDQLLAAVGSRLARQARLLSGRAARMGGDEFLLALPAVGLAEHTRQIEAVLRSLSAPVQADSHRGPAIIRPSATAGVASSPDSDWIGLLSAADHALHEARLLGTHLVCHGDPNVSTFINHDQGLQ